MTIYAVSQYMDSLRIVTEKRLYLDGKEMNHYFNDERSAKEFIIARAASLLLSAEDAVVLAKKRHAKCVKKFGERKVLEELAK